MDQDETSSSEAEVETVSPAPRRRWATRRSYQWAVLVVCALVALTGGLVWWQAAHDADLERAQDRDTVLVQARQNIATMNTLDYRDVDAGVKAWAGVTTGTLHDQLTQVSAEDRKLLAEQKKTSTGKVVEAAVVDFDDTTATIVASVEVTVRDGAKPDADPTVKRNRFSAELQRVRGDWKLESLQQVAVDLS